MEYRVLRNFTLRNGKQYKVNDIATFDDITAKMLIEAKFIVRVGNQTQEEPKENKIEVKKSGKPKKKKG